MSLTSNELNYLIWRYLQESGHELSSYAIQQETNLVDLKLDSLYSKRVPMGTLVDLVQKGILYNKVNDLLTTSELKAASGSNNSSIKDIPREGVLKIVDEEVLNLNLNLFNAIVEESKKPVLEDSHAENLNGNGQLVSANTNNNKGDEMDEDAEDELLFEEENDENDFIGVAESYLLFSNSLSNAWNPIDSDKIAYGHKNIVTIYNDKTKESITLNHPSYCKEIILISYSPNGKYILTSTMNGELRIWDPHTGILKFILALHKVPVLTIKWNNNQPDYLLSLDLSNKAIVWNINTGNSVQLIDLNVAGVPSNSGLISSMSPGSSATANLSTSQQQTLGTDACWIDYTKFVIPGVKYSLLVYNIGDVQPLGVLSGHMDSISNITYNFDLKLLASASDDNTVRIWQGDSNNSMQLLIGHSQPITYLQWINLNSKDIFNKGNSENSTIVNKQIPIIISCSLDGTIKIWDVKTGELISNTVIENGLPIYQASLSNEVSKEGGLKLVTGDSECNVIVWDLSIERLNKMYYKFNKLLNYNNSILKKRQRNNNPVNKFVNKKIINQKIKAIQMYQPKETDQESEEEIEKEHESNNIIKSETSINDDLDKVDYISCLNWSQDNSKIFISFSKSKSCIIKV